MFSTNLWVENDTQQDNDEGVEEDETTAEEMTDEVANEDNNQEVHFLH